MRKTMNGFTIVELVVVIVVIGVLATISIVAYNGIQQRSRTSQTINAATQWVKGLMIYKAKNGGLPNTNSCLGAGYKYNSDGAGASGTGQCFQNGASGTTVSSAFSTTMSSYMTGLPSPAMVSAVNSPTVWWRGIIYNIAAGNTAQIIFVLDKGQACPAKLAEYALGSTTTATDSDIVCTYSIGSTVSYDFS